MLKKELLFKILKGVTKATGNNKSCFDNSSVQNQFLAKLSFNRQATLLRRQSGRLCGQFSHKDFN